MELVTYRNMNTIGMQRPPLETVQDKTMSKDTVIQYEHSETESGNFWSVMFKPSGQ